MDMSLDTIGIAISDGQLREATGATFTASVTAQVLQEIKGGALPR